MTPEPRLIFGIISDLHMRGTVDEESVRKSLVALRDQGVTAVAVAGDVTDGSGRDALVASAADRFLPFARVWNAVFPRGCGVELLLVLGERDFAAGDVKEAWYAAFGKEYAPCEIRDVRSCRFVLCREPDGTIRLPTANCQLPTFVVRHFPIPEKDLPPDVVAITGHACTPLTDPRTIRICGGGVMVDASSLLHVRASGGRENALAEGLPPEAAEWRHMPDISREAAKARHGLVVRVDAGGVAFRRLDLALGRALSDDVTIPMAGRGAPTSPILDVPPPPEFPKGAEALVEEGTGKTMSGKVERQLTVRFPAARVPSRAFDYAVTVRYAEAGLVKTAVEKRVYAYGLFCPEDEPVVSCVFGFEELPWDVELDLEIAPRTAYGDTGMPLRAQAYIESPQAREERLKKERKAAAAREEKS